MAHSFVQAHASERAAFEAFAREFPGTTLLVDTYDTLDGVDEVIRLARKTGPAYAVGGVRLDSGDLLALARAARARLDAAGLTHVKIFGSGGLGEDRVAHLVGAGAPIDSFGVGTDMVVSADSPALDMAYKLVEYDGRPTTKLSSRKTILPGRKQVFRSRVGERLGADTIALVHEDLAGKRLLERAMHRGERCDDVSLALSRRRAIEALRELPAQLREIDPARAQPAYRVETSPMLDELVTRLRGALPSAARGSLSDASRA